RKRVEKEGDLTNQPPRPSPHFLLLVSLFRSPPDSLRYCSGGSHRNPSQPSFAFLNLLLLFLFLQVLSYTMGDNTIKTEDYTSLKEFRVDIDVAKGEEENEAEMKLSMCFWLYLVRSSSSVSYPAQIINQLQVGSDVSFFESFLFLDERRIMMLRPLCLVRKDSPPQSNSASLLEAPHALMVHEFPFEKWVHVGYEVSANVLHLHINGENLVELCFPLPSMPQSNSDGFKTITLVGPSIDNCLQGYVHDLHVSHISSSVRDCYFKDPPLQLSIDNSSTIEIEEDNDGVWSIIGGKASCRRIFSLDVVLSNAVNQSINNELEVISSLLYADNGLPVEKTSDDEAPLLASFDGIEFPSCDRPSKLLNGRTSFKLKISQLSSKCENRLFHIKFELLKYKGYHFLEAFSHPIRCISRNRNPRPSSAILKRPTSAQYYLSDCPSIASDNGSLELHNSLHEGNATPSSKRSKLVQEKTSLAPQLEEEGYSQALTGNQAEAREHVEAGNSPYDSESTEERISDYNIGSYSISDPMIFKYCLGSLTDRALLMKEVSTSASDEELFRFADKVCLYSGCAHHR
ncbi:SH2 domain-containing protein A, partial [Linum grandiflorum]